VLDVRGLPIAFFDEGFTSAHAVALLLAAELTKTRRKERLDKLAAQILLAAYLESTSRGTEEPLALDDENPRHPDS
jgi:putative Holliday junction resolvase